MQVNLLHFWTLIRDSSLTICVISMCACSKNNRSIDTPVKGPPQGPRLHIDIPRVQLLIEDKEGIKQIGMWLFETSQISLFGYFLFAYICAWTVFSGFLLYNRGGQGCSAGDRHRVQPISEPAELLHRRVSAPPSPYPEFRAFDWHVRHPPRHKWVFLFE